MNSPSTSPKAPDYLSSILFVLLLILCCAFSAAAAEYKLFSTFQMYDDEGYVLISTKYFLHGSRLYDQVYTQYGPLFYSYAWLLYGFLGIDLSNDAARFFTLAHWMGIAGLCGWFLYRASGSRLLTCAGFLLTFMHLAPLANEPGHPQGLCGLLVATALALCTFAGRRGFTHAMTIAGLVTGALGMIKINLGAFVFVALSLALLTVVEASRFTALLRWVNIGFAFVIAPILMRQSLADPWVFTFWIAWTLTVLSVLLAVRPSAPDRIAGESPYLGFVTAAAAMFLGIGLSQWVQGLSIATLAYGILGQHIKFASAFYFFAEVPVRAAVVAGSAATLASLYRRRATFPQASQRHFERGVVGAKLLYGLAVIGGASVAYWKETLGEPIGGGTFVGNAHALLLYGLPFAWLLLAEPRGGLAPPQRFSRLALCLVASFQALQIYPIAGTQMAFATFLLLPIGLLCVHDVATLAAQGSPSRKYARQLGYGLMVLVLLTISVRRDRLARRQYQESAPLGLPGAARIRLPEATAKDLVRLVGVLRAHCDTFVSFPGRNSLYFWTGVAPPTPFNATFWPNMLDSHQQEEIARALAEHSKACFVADLRSQSLFDSLGYSPLARYLDGTFHSVGAIGPYDLRIRNDRKIHDLIGDPDP